MAAAGVGGQNISLSGVLTTISPSSPVTSATRTIGGTGELQFSNVLTDSGTPQYSYNGGAWTNITEGGTLTVADASTLAVRAALPTVATEASFTLTNNNPGMNDKLIENVILQKS